MFRMRALVGFCTFLVAGCVHPEAYRVVQEGKVVTIYQPNTRALDNGDGFSVDVLNVIPFNSRCRRSFDSEGLTARRISVQVQGRTVRALRFTRKPPLSADPIEDRQQLETDLGNWWAEHGANNSKCFSSNAKESVIRSVLSQRPMTPEVAIAEWYGPGPLPGAYRAVVLRPGMRVCVSTVMPADAEQVALVGMMAPNAAAAAPEGRSLAQTGLGYRFAGSSCARLVEGISGPTLDPVASRLYPGLIASSDAPAGDGRRTINAWAEIEPVPWSQSVYMLLQPIDMPTVPPRPGNDPDYGKYSILAIAAPRDKSASSDSSPLAAVIAATRFDRVNDLCSTKADVLRCIRFGERGVFSADFPVRVNGTLVDVPVGATLESVLSLTAPDMLAQDLIRGQVGADKDPAAGFRRARLLRHLRMWRWFEGRRVPVLLDGPSAALPLQPGDEIQW
jgi:hypothetical protein